MAKSANPRAQREREADRQQAQEEARRAAYQRAVRKRRLIGVGVVVVVVLAAGGAIFAASGSKSSKTAASQTVTNPSVSLEQPTTSVSNSPPASLPQVAAGAALAGTTPCPAADGSSPRTTMFGGPPPTCIDPKNDYTAIVHTSKGDLTVALLPSAAPGSVNNFVTLARYHYYDGLPVTKVVSRGWAEVDDPTFADGTKGPGYTIAGEAPAQGSVATPLIFATLPSSSGASGGGFIFGLADQAAGMPKSATQIGNILDSRIDTSKPPEGQSTVQHLIDVLATKAGAPSEVVTITGIDIEETPPTA